VRSVGWSALPGILAWWKGDQEKHALDQTWSDRHPPPELIVGQPQKCSGGEGFL